MKTFIDIGQKSKMISIARKCGKKTLFAITFMCIVNTVQAKIPTPDFCDNNSGFRIVLDERVHQNVVILNENLPDDLYEVVNGIIARQIDERTYDESKVSEEDLISVILSVKEGVGKEGYTINKSGNKWYITGNDRLGIFYGIGRFLHEGCFSGSGFIPGEFTGTSLPETPIRGIYMANPGWNWYGSCTEKEMSDYIEDILLWGANSIAVVSPGPGSQDGYVSGQYFKSSNAKRIVEMVEHANHLGMTTAVLTISNLSWIPERSMLADWTGGKNGYSRNLAAHAHMETCPSADGGMEFIVKGQKAALKYFKNSPPTYICLWPYDEGGCTCADCAPWGGNGYLRIAKAISTFLREEFPQSTIMLSTWLFDSFTSGEYEILEKEIAEDSGWLDMLMANFEPGTLLPGIFQNKKTAGLPVVDFPEISMFGMVPYGGFGANPTPERLEKMYQNGKDIFDGGYPYSEGLYDDINKVVYLQLCWGMGKVENIVRQYCAYEYGAENSATMTRAIMLLEKTTMRNRLDTSGRNQNYPQPSSPPAGAAEEQRFVLSNKTDVPKAHELILSVNEKLSGKIRERWRWQIVYLRSFIDDELVNNMDLISAECDAAFEKLIKIYKCENNYYTSPPSLRIIAAGRGLFDF